MIEYQKLVRDRIPQIIRDSGEEPILRILEDEEYRVCLEAKLDEEVAEFHTDKNLEELADILEVVYALAGDREALEAVYQRKHEARGGFEKRYFLIGKKEEGEV